MVSEHGFCIIIVLSVIIALLMWINNVKVGVVSGPTVGAIMPLYSACSIAYFRSFDINGFGHLLW